MINTVISISMISGKFNYKSVQINFGACFLIWKAQIWLLSIATTFNYSFLL